MINLHEGFVFEVHFFDDRQHRVVDAAFMVFVEVFYVDGFAVFNDDVGLLNFWQVCLPYLDRKSVV